MEPTKDENRRRRRRISIDSPQSVPGGNTEAHASSETIDRGSSAAVLTASENHITSPDQDEVQAQSSVEAPLADIQTRHTGKRRASGEMIRREEESKAIHPAAQGVEIRRPDLPERAVVSPQVSREPESILEQRNEVAVAVTPMPLRISTRRTTTTTRWSPSMAGGRDQRVSRTASRSRTASGTSITPPTRPISNATRNINFDMLQPHFERPLQQAADSFGVCTTLLKKICRRNGISNWPYRKICGLRKSIASMTKQVNYFDGEQKRAYADQLEKLEHELQAFLRTGNELTEELLQQLKAEAAAAKQPTVAIDNEEEEKEAQVVPAWTARPSLVPPQYSGVQNELQTTPRHLAMSLNTWTEAHTHQFPTIATHHRALPSIASILQHQSYSSPSRAASTQDPQSAQQPTQWRYFPPPNDDAV
ncbi:Protein NLP2 [Phytophthora citrophthora]|uniref:Protein NLP2 n=1 Tax=Phytophthora citrophthora TaxID=4793 RepID=A0AAD9G3Y5_9STRA|nr:Protein NLP2 [Phytophthora citrophthora]